MIEATPTNSPCRRGTGDPDACTLEDGVCRGCGRKTDEILRWKDMEEEERARVREVADARTRARRGATSETRSTEPPS